MERCEQFQVIVSSERDLTEEEEAGSWLVSVQLCLSGSPLEVKETVQDCRLTSDRTDITVTFLGLANVRFRAVITGTLKNRVGGMFYGIDIAL